MNDASTGRRSVLLELNQNAKQLADYRQRLFQTNQPTPGQPPTAPISARSPIETISLPIFSLSAFDAYASTLVDHFNDEEATSVHEAYAKLRNLPNLQTEISKLNEELNEIPKMKADAIHRGVGGPGSSITKGLEQREQGLRKRQGETLMLFHKECETVIATDTRLHAV